MAVVFLMFTQYRERPILLGRRRDLNTEGKKMNEINQCRAVSLLVKMLEAARVSLDRDTQISVLPAYVSPLQAKTNITLQNSFWAWFGG